MRKTRIALMVTICLLTMKAFSQFYAEPIAGYQKNLSDPKNNLFELGIQLALKIRNYELLFEVQKSWPDAAQSNDSSFTLNAALPFYAPAIKTISPRVFSMAVGNRFKVAGRKSKNSLFLKFYTGVMFQKTVVTYQYDQKDYVVLNPDQTRSVTGLYLSGGCEYMRDLGLGRLFVELNLSSPPFAGYHYPESFSPVAPLSVNIGFSVMIIKIFKR